jgi:hypothetical protein
MDVVSRRGAGVRVDGLELPIENSFSEGALGVGAGSGSSFIGLGEGLVQGPPLDSFIVRAADQRTEMSIERLCECAAVAHVLGDRVALKSGYEGWRFERGGTLILELLKICQTTFFSDESEEKRQLLSVINVLEVSLDGSCDTTESIALYFHRQIEGLAPGAKLLIPSGWTNESGGHAILVEVICTQTGLFDLFVYNTGSGSDSASSIVKSFIDRRVSSISFRNIKKKALLEGSPHSAWLQTLFEIRDKPSSHGNDYDMDTILQVCFSTLMEKRERTKSGTVYFREQHSGTCSYRSILAWLHSQLSPHLYKAVVTWVQTQVLLRAYKHKCLKKGESSLSFNFLSVCARELQLHSIGRLRKHRGELGDRLGWYLGAGQIGQRLVREIDQKISGGPFLELSDSSLLLLAIGESQRNLARNWPLLCSGQTQSGFIPTDQFKGIFRLDRNFLSGREFCEAMRVLRIHGVFEKESYLSAVADFILALPKVSEIKRNWLVELVEGRSVLREIYQLQLLFYPSGTFLLNPALQTAALKLLAISHMIACEASKTMGDRGLLEAQGLPNLMDAWLEDKFEIIIDQKMIEEIEDLRLYFEPFQRNDLRETLLDTVNVIITAKLDKDYPSNLVRWAFQLVERCESSHFTGAGTRAVKVQEIINKNPNRDVFDFGRPDTVGLQFIYSLFVQIWGLLGSANLRNNFTFSLESRRSDSTLFTLNYHVIYGGTISLKDRREQAKRSLSLHNSASLESLSENDFFKRGGRPREESAIGLNEKTPLSSVIYAQSVLSEEPCVILHYFQEQLITLHKPGIISLWVIAMLKSGLSDDVMTLPMRKALLEESFRLQFESFIERAIRLHVDQTIDGTVNHEVALQVSIVALIARSQYLEATGKDLLEPPAFPLLRAYLESPITPEMAPKDQQIRYQMQVFNACLFDHPERALEGWVMQKALMGAVAQEKRLEWFRQIVSRMYFQKVENFIRMLPDPNRLAKTLFWKLALREIDFQESWSSPRTTLLEARRGTQRFIMDLLEGILSTDEGVLTISKAPVWIESPAFKGLFPSGITQYRIEGVYLIFDVNGRTFRARREDFINWERNCAIYDHGVWLQFLPPYRKEINDVLPSTLAQRYLYFSNFEKSLIYGLDRKTFEVAVTITREGIRSDVQGTVVEKLSASNSLFQGVVSSDNVEVHHYPDSTTRLKFRTLRIWEGGEISLVKKGERYELESHPGYFLITGEEKPKAFKKIKEWIFFRNEKGDSIYYLPVGKLEKEKDDEFRLLLKIREWFKTIDHKTHLLEYTQSSSGPLIATTAEGSFYLAVLWLMQNEYQLFLDEITKCAAEDLSPKALKEIILERVLWFKMHHNNSPKHLACLCHLIKHLQRFLPKDNERIVTWIKFVYDQYYKIFDRVPIEIRLPATDEWEMARYWSMLNEGRSLVLMGSTVLDSTQRRDVQAQTQENALKLTRTSFSMTSNNGYQDPSNEFSKVLARNKEINSLSRVDKPKAQMIVAAMLYRGPKELDQLRRFIKAHLNLENNQYGKEFLFILYAILHSDKLNTRIYERFAKLFPIREHPTPEDCLRINATYTEFLNHAASKVRLNKLHLKESVRLEERRGNPLKARHHTIQDYPTRDLESSFRWDVARPLIGSVEDGIVTREKPIRSEFAGLDCRFMTTPGKEVAIIEEARAVRADLLLGIEKLKARREVSFLGHLGGVRERFKEEIERDDGVASLLEKRICGILNFLPPHDLATQLERGGALRNQATMKEAVYLFLRGSKKLFLKENSYLDETNIALLINLTEEWLVLQTELQHKKRIMKLFKKHDAIVLESIEKGHIREEIYKALLAERQYTDQDPHYFLVFEYAMDMRLRKEQIELISQMLMRKPETGGYQDMIAQLAMGGGKTSVLAVILLAMAADTGGFGMMCTPKSQFQSVKKDLKAALFKVFNKKLYTIEIGIEDLDSIEKVVALHRKLHFACRCGDVVLTNPESMQILKLEFERFGEGESRLKEIAKILKLLKTKCHVLIDEEHSVLDPFKEVNIPEGVKKCMNPDDIQAIQFVYEAMTDSSVSDMIGISLNRQAELATDYFKDTIIPRLAGLLVSKLLKNPGLEGFGDHMIAFFSGEDVKPLELMQKIKELAESESINDQKMARQIALIKHVLFDVLPSTLTKSCGRNYGRISSGKVVPYQGVDTPSFSEFGYHVEAACYQVAAALQVGINEEQIKDLALKMIGHAVKTAMRRDLCVRQTPENLKFYKMTGIYLDEVEDIEKLRAATRKLAEERARGEYRNIFAFEAETIMAHISYHTYRMTSGPHSFLSLFASRRAFSGTPFPETCPESMESRYLAEQGSEGQVLALLLDRNSRSSHVHIIDSVDPVSMLDKVMSLYPEKPERVSMLLDPAGLFKDSNTLAVAIWVRNCLYARGSKFKGVLFFARPFQPLDVDFLEPEYLGTGVKREQNYRLGPDRLAFLPLHSDDIMYLPGSDEDALALVGLKPGDYFVICDERHTIGTNIKMSPDAVGIMTMNEMLTHATASQAIMRLRQYTSSQDVHVMLPRQTEAKFGTSIVEMMIRASALEKSEVMLRSFYQKVDNVTNEMAVNLLIDQVLADQNAKRMQRIKEELTPCLVYAIQDEPLSYLQAEMNLAQTALLIENRYKRRKQEFRAILERLSIPFGPYEELFRAKWESIQRQMRASPFLPVSQRVKIGVDDFGQEVEQLTEVAEVAQELEIENEQEILQEMRRINDLYRTNREGRDQIKWDGPNAVRFLRRIQEENQWSGKALHVNSLESFFIDGFPELIQFKGTLDPNLLCTENFARVYRDKQLPLFHRETRPVVNMLLIQTNTDYKMVLLSLEESAFWREYLHTTLFSDVWLLDKHGESIADVVIDGNLQALPIPGEEQVYRLLVQVNALAGKVSFLGEHKAEVTDWLSEKPRERQNLIKYAVLSQNDPEERDLFFENTDLSPETAQEIGKSRVRFLVHRSEQLGRAGEDLSLLTIQEIEGLSTESDIERLSVEQIQFLSRDQIYALKKRELIQVLRPEMLPYVRDESICHLSDMQVRDLGVSKKVKFLEGVDQINAVTPDQIMLLTPDQRLLLDPAHRETYEQERQKYQQFTGAQLSGVEDDEVVDAVEENQVHRLTTEEIGEIRSERLMLRLTDEQIEKLTSAQIIKIQSSELIDRLSARQVIKLTKNELKKIECKHLYNRLAKRQLMHLTDPQILQLNFEQARKFIKAAPERSSKLTKENIQKLSLSHLWNLPKATIQMATTFKKVTLFAAFLFKTISLCILALSCYPFFILLSPFSRKIRQSRLSLRARITHSSRLMRA